MTEFYERKNRERLSNRDVLWNVVRSRRAFAQEDFWTVSRGYRFIAVKHNGAIVYGQAAAMLSLPACNYEIDDFGHRI